MEKEIYMKLQEDAFDSGLIVEVSEMILRHTREQIELKGEFTGIREMRKHVAWYTTGMRHSAALRREASEIESYEGLERLLEKLKA